ncbi:hypothetical protein ABKA04_006010 [Annulohypoxylon sp. FPYF3050]
MAHNSDMPGAPPGSSRSSKRRGGEENGTGKSPQKRRRRAFSCLSCQKLKCRLQRYEDELRELKSTIKDLTSGAQPQNDRTQVGRDSTYHSGGHASHTGQGNSNPEFLSVPADKGAQTAPIVVLRSISQQITKGCRRLLGHININLVQLQLLDEQTANELIQLFFRYQGHNLLVCGIEDLTANDETRKISDFLRSVCILIGVVYRDDICGTSIHRQIYEQVRVTLGQALLSSPLNLEEINAVLIMSNNANSPSSNGHEYVDSWLLTGYCAKQAMLSICFSKIINNIKEVGPRRRATMQDGMLVAEIFLYSTLHQKLAHQSYLGDGGECKEFLVWKEKWNHLLGLSTSAMLRIGYHAACLILAVRSLEEVGQGLRPREFLSGADGDNESDSENHTSRHSRRTRENDGDILRSNACRYAMIVLQTFLEMPPFLMDAVPTCLCLCIGYCALLLAHHDESQSKISDQVSLDLICRIDQWIRTSPGKAWSYKYGTLAKHKIELRMNGSSTSTSSRQPSMRVPTEDQNDCQDRTSVPTEVDGHSTRKPTHETAGYHTNEVFGSSVQLLESESIFPSFDLSDNAIFPSMEDFFGGGFLDFVG